MSNTSSGRSDDDQTQPVALDFVDKIDWVKVRYDVNRAMGHDDLLRWSCAHCGSSNLRCEPLDGER